MTFSSPSMLSSDFANLEGESRRMVECGADWLHLDVMDGHFVPNLTIGAPVVKSLRAKSDAFLDCHLMVSDPERWVEDFANAGANLYTFHIEATRNLHLLTLTPANPLPTITKIRQTAMRVGLAISPHSPLSLILPYCHLVDLILVMTVEPGYGGQAFQPASVQRIREIRDAFPGIDVQVDGGIGVENVELVCEAGANIVVAGTGIFKAKDPKAAITTMRECIERHLLK